MHHTLSGSTSLEAGAKILHRLLEVLRANGLPTAEDARGLVDAHAPLASDEPIAGVLSRALSLSGELPMFVDLAGHTTERHRRRQLSSFLQRYGMPFSSWVDLRQSLSLTTATLSLSLPNVHTELVARATGFASPTGLCHALRRFDLDAPQQIARRTAALRRELEPREVRS